MISLKNIFINSAKLSWKNKYLWFFGLFASIIEGSDLFQIITKALNLQNRANFFPGLKTLASTGVFHLKTFSNLWTLLTTKPLLTLSIIFFWILILVVFVFIIWLAVVSQASIINNANALLKEKNIGFANGLKAGIRKFWPVLGLNVVLKFFIFIIPIAIALPLLGGLSYGRIIFIILFVVFIPIAITISLTIKYSIIYVILKGQKIQESFRSGWKLFLDNWTISLEIGILLFLINAGGYLVASLIVLGIAIPFYFLIAFFISLGSFAGFMVVVALGLMILFIIIALTGAILTVFQLSVWTNLFQDLNSGIKSGILSRFFKTN